MENKPKILAFAGSLRKASYNKRIARIVAEGATVAGAEVTFIDLNDYSLPVYNADYHESGGFPENAIKLQRTLNQHDGLIVSSPEYNGSLPGGLKNAIDWASRESEEFALGQVFRGKYAAITTASPGAFGGLRCLGHLRSVLSILLVTVLPTEFAVAKAHTLFEGDDGEILDEKMKGLLLSLGASLAETLIRHQSGQSAKTSN